MTNAANDPYLDPATGILRNKRGITSEAELTQAEADITSTRLAIFWNNPPDPTGDLDELRAIHRFLFEPIFDWAGQVRTIDMRKGDGPLFVPASMLDRYAANAAAELAADNMLADLDRDQFIERLAHHYDQINDGHFFRDGNGRTGRVFWERVANDAGWSLDWTLIGGAENDHAFLQARHHGDLAPLTAVLDRVVEPYDPAIHHDTDTLVARAGFRELHQHVEHQQHPIISPREHGHGGIDL